MEKHKIDRINELAKKAKEGALTPEEERERAELRAEYIAGYRANLRGMLDTTVIERPDGSREALKKK
jgi:uncharacterized protein YnzC (UPF0291/DUF896 family)